MNKKKHKALIRSWAHLLKCGVDGQDPNEGFSIFKNFPMY